MALTISAAARKWGTGRETIYRRQLAGKLSFATTDPPTVEATEMQRAFGDPKPRPDRPAPCGKVAPVARFDAACAIIRAEADRLKAELRAIKQALDAAQENARNEHEQWLRLLATQQLLESHAALPQPVFEPGEAAVAQAVLVAQQRVKGQAGKPTLLDRLRLKNEKLTSTTLADF